MSEQEIIEGNKLIARFDKLKFVGNYMWERWEVGKELLTASQLKYHSSWDWQIPVYGKIARLVREVAVMTGDS